MGLWTSSHQAIAGLTAGIAGVEGCVIKTNAPAYPALSVSWFMEATEARRGKPSSGLILPNTVQPGFCLRLRTPLPTPGGQALDPSSAPHPV